MRRVRLRTKFLIALLAISAGLTMGVLVAVRYSMEKSIRLSLLQDLQTSANGYLVFGKQRTNEMAHSAALIANLPNVRALMTSEDEATIQDASADILQLSGADLLALADRTGKLVAVHTRSSSLERADVQKLLSKSLQLREGRDWWFTNNRLFEAIIQPVEFGPAQRRTTIGLLRCWP